MKTDKVTRELFLRNTKNCQRDKWPKKEKSHTLQRRCSGRQAYESTKTSKQPACLMCRPHSKLHNNHHKQERYFYFPSREKDADFI